MVDEIKLHQQRARGQEAARLWENSMIQGFFTAMENRINEGWRETKADEAEARERAYVMQRLLENFKQQFKSYIYTGEIAMKDMLEIERSKEAKR